MQAYKFDTRITKDGTISLLFVPILFDREIEVIIVPKTDVREAKYKISLTGFMRKWSGVMKDMPENDADGPRYKYLRKKYALITEQVSDKEIDGARLPEIEKISNH